MIVVLDTETTGLPRHSWARVVEVAAVALDDRGVEVGCFSALVRASWEDCERGSEALAVNGISPAMLESAPRVEDVGVALAAWVALHGACEVTSFNVDFDRLMVERTFPGLSLSWGECVMLRAMGVMGPLGLLPPSPARGRGDRWKWPSLREAMGHFGVEREGDAHRALSDARAAAGVWRRLTFATATAGEVSS
jgi:DNA polymerase III epsilon subunit-like protein